MVVGDASRGGEALAASPPPAGCFADHATTSDRYSSMRFDPIDRLVHTFDSPGVVLSIRVKGRCSGLFVAQKSQKLTGVCLGLTKKVFSQS